MLHQGPHLVGLLHESPTMGLFSVRDPFLLSDRDDRKKGGQLIEMTEREIRRLLNRTICRAEFTLESSFFWSYWRRRHQLTAKICHYKTNRYNKLQL